MFRCEKRNNEIYITFSDYDYFNPIILTNFWKVKNVDSDLFPDSFIPEKFNNVFTYKILRPQTVIHNEVINKTVSHYIGLGLDIPIKQIKPFIPNVELVYTDPKFYIGVGYNGGLNCPTIKGGSTILRW